MFFIGISTIKGRYKFCIRFTSVDYYFQRQPRISGLIIPYDNRVIYETWEKVEIHFLRMFY